MLHVAKYFKVQWGTRLAQRFIRGHLARKTHGGALAELRAKRRAREEVVLPAACSASPTHASCSPCSLCAA